MAIPIIDFLEAPYNDTKLEYDYNEQRYIPLVDGIREHAYVNLIRDWKTPENAQSYLDLLSRVLYETILANQDVRYRLKMKYYLSHSKRMRDLIFALMCDSAWYNRRDGGFMMAYNSGANLNQGKLIEFGLDKAVSTIANQIIKNTMLGTRYLPINVDKSVVLEDFDEVKTYLLDNGYIVQDDFDKAETLNGLPYDDTYRVTKQLNGKYLFRDLLTLKKAIENMKIYNTNGTW